MGIINAAQPASAPDLIQQARSAFEQRVPKEQQDILQRIILAGKKVLYDQTTNSEVEKRIQDSPTPAEAAGSGAVELLGVLAHESRGTLPQALIGPSAAVLMTEILDYLKQTGRIKGDAADLEAAAKALSETMMKGSGVTPEGFDQILGKMSQSMQDPKIAAAVQQHMQGA
jgi:hypothetical protein